MCGIIGYIGFRDAKNVLIDCLKRLDYRGYDSAGIGILQNEIQIFKEIGDIANLEKEIPSIEGNTGIGHTRWATHGKVSIENAHPQIGCNKRIALVHNGIIENFKILKEELEKKGHKFLSQTDTEVIAHLIDEEYSNNLEEAVFNALKKIKGSYAITVLCEDDPEKIIGARKDSPLVIGVGDNENFIASDIPALLKYTNRVIYLEDGELCIITKDKTKVIDENKNEVIREEELIKWDFKDAEKSGFPHFMLKEIYEQPDAIVQSLMGRLSEIEHSINFHDKVEELLKDNYESIHIVACGTSYYAGLVGKYLIENLTNLPVFIDLASEYRYFGTKIKSSLVIGITQSGETADTLAALKQSKESGCKTIVISNVIGSTATRLANGYILMQSGPEIGVAASKTFTSQIITLFLISLKIASIKNKIGSDEIYKHILNLKELPRQTREVLDRSAIICEIAENIKDANTVFFIGRGLNYPLSLEGALKLKEISYIHAEGFAAGELKHGPFALLTCNTPVVAIVTKDSTYDKIIANIGEIKARGPKVIALAHDKDTEIDKHADMVIRYPSNSQISSCVSVSVILQLLAYHVANLRGCPIDKPRNLAKSVTVE